MKYYEDVNEQARRYALDCIPKSNQSACVWDDEIRPMLAQAYLKGYEDAGNPLEKYLLLDIDKDELFKALDSQTEKILAAKERIMEREVERELAKLKLQPLTDASPAFIEMAIENLHKRGEIELCEDCSYEDGLSTMAKIDAEIRRMNNRNDNEK